MPALRPDRVRTLGELESVLSIERPHPNLMKYYALQVLAYLPLFPLIPIVGLLLYFRYHTMRYQFDAEGVRMSWGILFRREVTLAYARIQDIHLTSNFVERWLGLARIQISTASGAAAAEMTIEGLLEFELVRDFLYGRMRGAGPSRPAVSVPAADASLAAVADALRQVAADLRAVRAALEAPRPDGR